MRPLFSSLMIEKVFFGMIDPDEWKYEDLIPVPNGRITQRMTERPVTQHHYSTK